MNVLMDYLAGKGGERIISISDHAKEQLIDRYGFEKSSIKMIPHGVNIDKFYPRKEVYSKVDCKKTTLLYVGRIGPRKGLELVLNAINKIGDDDIEFLIAGTGRHENHLQRLTAEINVTSQVKFLGYVPSDDLPILYSSADIFLLPSRYEGFGLVLLEAMACGTPVIGSNAGGIPTVINDGVSGFIVNRKVESFTNAISSLVEDDNKRIKMGSKARNNALETSWEKVVAEVEELYRACVTTPNYNDA
jgi:glycosyltransferase involved in cell wall biosynthesis